MELQAVNLWWIIYHPKTKKTLMKRIHGWPISKNHIQNIFQFDRSLKMTSIKMMPWWLLVTWHSSFIQIFDSLIFGTFLDPCANFSCKGKPQIKNSYSSRWNYPFWILWEIKMDPQITCPEPLPGFKLLLGPYPWEVFGIFCN